MCSHLLKHKLPPHTRLVDQTQITWFAWSLCVVDSGLPLVGNTTEDALQLLAPRTPEIRYYMASQPVTKLCKGGRKLFQFQLMWIRRNADINLTVGTIFGERSIACYMCTFCCSSWKLTLSLLVISFFFHFWSSIHHGQEDRDWYRSWNHLQFLGSTLGKLEGSSHICTSL